MPIPFKIVVSFLDKACVFMIFFDKVNTFSTRNHEAVYRFCRNFAQSIKVFKLKHIFGLKHNYFH